MLVSPQKPVWLVQDLYNLGWSAQYPEDEVVDDDCDPDEVDKKDMTELFEPPHDGSHEKEARELFESLYKDKVDLVQLFPSLQAWQGAATNTDKLLRCFLSEEAC